jgi:uncharacterized DUF497 family protein
MEGCGIQMTTVVVGEFEWDPAKAATNHRKHGVRFEEAMECFLDPLAIAAPDKEDPSRFVLIGMSLHSRLLFVVSAKSTRTFASLAREKRRLINARCTKMARKRETDLSRYDWTKATRGKYLQKANRSFESVILDRKAVKTLGGPDAIREIVETLARTICDARKKHRAA